MITKYFLGANSGTGFVSLYDGFCAAPGDFLYIIKGGPGGGKSSFMRAIGKAAEERGLDVSYVLCSGDPDSLDGVYIPALKMGYVDGTSPHVIEPRHVGADGNYVNLGCFCSCEMDTDTMDEIAAQTARYKAFYSQAYSYMAAAAKVLLAENPGVINASLIDSVACRAVRAVRREVGKRGNFECGSLSRRFLSANSGSGVMQLNDELCKLAPRLYRLDNKLGLGRYYLDAAAKEAVALGQDIIVCPRPLTPEISEAVILPDLGVGFTTMQSGEKAQKHVRLDSMADTRPSRGALSTQTRLYNALMDEAAAALRQAKVHHDALEKAFHPYIDFAGLTKYTHETIEALFS